MRRRCVESLLVQKCCCVGVTTQMLNASEELANAHLYPNVRVFTVAEIQSPDPLYDLKQVEEGWSLPSKGVVFNVSWLIS